jgi:hypothetical protein
MICPHEPHSTEIADPLWSALETLLNVRTEHRLSGYASLRRRADSSRRWLWEIARQSGRPMEYRLLACVPFAPSSGVSQASTVLPGSVQDQQVATMGRKSPDVTFCKCPTLGVWEAYASNRVAYGVSFVCPLILRPRRSVLVQAAFG